ncbi:MAG: hypothetical protein V4736_02065 [Bdellovibrionota bacterium]
MSKNTKLFLKILAGIAAFFGVVLIVTAVLLFRMLPTPATLGRLIKPNPKPISASSVSADATVSESSNRFESESNLTVSADITSTDPSRPGSLNVNSRTAEGRAILKDLTNPNAPLVDFCSSLVNAKRSLERPKEDVLAKRLKRSTLDNEKDPLSESFKPVVRSLLRQPEMSELLHMVESAAEQNDESTATKASFYRQAYRALSEIQNNRQGTESILDRTYLMWMLSRAVATNPELQSAPESREYCAHMETLVNGNEPGNFAHEKIEFQKFLESVKIDPKEIGFDPYYRTEIKPRLGKSSLTFKGSWLDEVLDF